MTFWHWTSIVCSAFLFTACDALSGSAARLQPLALGGVLILAPCACLFFGHVNNSLGLANTSAMINSLIVAGGVVFGLVFLKEWHKITALQLAGIAFTFCGILLILFGGKTE